MRVYEDELLDYVKGWTILVMSMNNTRSMKILHHPDTYKYTHIHRNLKILATFNIEIKCKVVFYFIILLGKLAY